MKTTKVICKQCGCEFEKENKKVNEAIKKKWNFFCSEKCLSKNRTRQVKTVCSECGKGILKKRSEVKEGKRNFCDKSCAAKYNGKKYPKRKKTYNNERLKECKNCGKDLEKYQKKYCSHSCCLNYQYKEYIEKWKKGEIDGSVGKKKEHISDHIIRYLREKYDNKCQKCEWDEVNIYTGKIPLDTHHIDGDWKNNNEENLELICNNCHSLTKNYGNSGKKRKGRSSKRDFYRRNGSSRGLENSSRYGV